MDIKVPTQGPVVEALIESARMAVGRCPGSSTKKAKTNHDLLSSWVGSAIQPDYRHRYVSNQRGSLWFYLSDYGTTLYSYQLPIAHTTRFEFEGVPEPTPVIVVIRYDSTNTTNRHISKAGSSFLYAMSGPYYIEVQPAACSEYVRECSVSPATNPVYASLLGARSKLEEAVTRRRPWSYIFRCTLQEALKNMRVAEKINDIERRAGFAPDPLPHWTDMLRDDLSKATAIGSSMRYPEVRELLNGWPSN